ncbi:MAG: Rieske (2Fe-2S) protein [Deltaproteobacteria bacterium]|nr:Rieske (2Fe-2S) protein [Deltaproteobacteria bacterium]
MAEEHDRQPAEQVGDADGPSRRDFLVGSGRAVLCACALGAAAGSLRLAIPRVQDGPPARFPVGRPGDFQMRTLTWLRERDLFVLRDEGGFGAMSARCTHLGCTVRRTADGFYCPCHGARFGLAGELVSGPAREPLPWYRLSLEPDGKLWVDRREEVSAGTRSLGEIEAGEAGG